MKAGIARLLEHLELKTREFEVEEELSLHIELLVREHIQQGMSPAEAKAATLKRFGDLDKIRNQCLEIHRRNRPLRRVLKAFSIFVALTGIAIHILSTDLHVAHVGDTLIAVAVSGRLLLYARGLSPASFLPKNKPSSLLGFTDGPHTSASR
jgi:hypothetical protein